MALSLSSGSLASRGAPAAALSPQTSRLRRHLVQLLAHLLVALVALVAIGGATRVMEAGLACPDWPLCYGSLLPAGRMTVQVFLEWFHRLDAFLVGIGLLVLALISLLKRASLPFWLPPLCCTAVLLVALQGALGALTVTQLLRFDIVTAHLGTALLLVALVSVMTRGLSIDAPRSDAATPWLGLAAAAVYLQCIGGGLMASQWATGRCLSLQQACLWLDLHRFGAVTSTLLVLLVSALLLRSEATRPSGRVPLLLASLLLVGVQLGLGLLSLRLALAQPLVTVAHQLVAALLVAVLSAALPRPTGQQILLDASR